MWEEKCLKPQPHLPDLFNKGAAAHGNKIAFPTTVKRTKGLGYSSVLAHTAY